MNKQARFYGTVEIEAIRQELKDEVYLPEVREKLKEVGKTYADNYIYRCATQHSYNNDIYDAMVKVANDRRKRREETNAKRREALGELMQPELA